MSAVADDDAAFDSLEAELQLIENELATSLSKAFHAKAQVLHSQSLILKRAGSLKRAKEARAQLNFAFAKYRRSRKVARQILNCSLWRRLTALE